MEHVHKSIEDCYCLSQAEHIAGSNTYTFKFNRQWRDIIHEHLTVSVRGIKLWLAPRHLWVDGLNVHYGTANKTESTGFTAMITGSMAEFNQQLAGKLEGYRVYYNPTNRRLVFSCDIGNYFDLDESFRMSHDLKVITGKGYTIRSEDDDDYDEEADYVINFVNSPDYPSNIIEVLERDNDQHITVFCFENVWDRQNVHIRASFVDLGYQNFLGVSNEQFIPPKEYPISFTDRTFWLQLYDSTESPVEIPPLDNKDTLMIELILNSYT